MSALRWIFAVPAAGVSAVLVLLCLAGAVWRACRKLRVLGARLVSDRPARDKHCPDPLLGQLREVLGDDVSDLDLPPGWDRVAVLRPRNPKTPRREDR